jgi:hypothetical protein
MMLRVPLRLAVTFARTTCRIELRRGLVLRIPETKKAALLESRIVSVVTAPKQIGP